jgi:hypothetical protein
MLEQRKPPSTAPSRADLPPGAEATVPQNVRYRRSDLSRFREHAKVAGKSYTTYMREATIAGDKVLYAEAFEKVHVRATAS